MIKEGTSPWTIAAKIQAALKPSESSLIYGLAGHTGIIFKGEKEQNDDKNPDPPHIIVLITSETHIHSSRSKLVKSFTAI